VVGVSTFNVIDVESIVSALITSERSRSDRFVEQRSESSARISAFQALNTSLLSVGTAVDAVVDSGFWVPGSVTSSDSGVATASASAGAVSRADADPANPFSLNVVRLAGSLASPDDTAQISYLKDGVTLYAESTSNTFSDLADFPGLTITAVGVGSVDLTPAATNHEYRCGAGHHGISAGHGRELHTESDHDTDRGRGGPGYRSHRP
jgi:flagellar capping protein FliD